MREKLQGLENQAKTAINKATSSKEIEDLRIKFLGKKGELTAILAGVGGLSAEERPIIGKVSNEVKTVITNLLDEKKTNFEKQELASQMQKESIDITLPGRRKLFGHQHILTQTLQDIQNIFIELGYAVAAGPDIEDDFHNFEALNFPKDHPAREMHDTFYVEGGKLLRTHTSGVQVRLMESQKPPIKAIMPGRVYRSDADVTHSPVFHQVEGLLIDKNVTMAHLKGTLEYFLQKMFGKDRAVRLRNSFFPFTEPSVEVDVQCFFCGGKGCNMCKGTGWIEIMGAGMVDPNVFKACGIDAETYTGFAFGMGVERIAILKHGINDIRLFFESDMRFLKQF